MSKILPPTIVRKEIDDSHYYWVNGEYFPGVTSIIDEAAPVGWQLKQFFIQNSPEEIGRKQNESLAFGSKVHGAIEQLLIGEKVNLAEDYPTTREKRYIMSFHDWFQAVTPRDFIAEHPIASVSMRYAGTLDFAGWLNAEKIRAILTGPEAKKFKPKKPEGLWIVDFKTSAGIYFNYKLQVMAYKKAYEEMYGVKVDHTGILRLGTKHSNGYEFVEVSEDEVNFEDFKRVYDIWLKLHGGVIPEPPIIDVYPDELQIVTKGGDKKE